MSEPIYEGVSWDELHASFRYDKVWVELTPTDGSKSVLINVTNMGRFRSGSTFFVEARTQDGGAIKLRGRCPLRTAQPATFELG
ncbi:MAG TPA: hypothetical protein VFH06_05760 [Candidatus Saccharimonadales bacterium]|nr:hypothetical protein [Candidatus Saccharimonadales bacterium]